MREILSGGEAGAEDWEGNSRGGLGTERITSKNTHGLPERVVAVAGALCNSLREVVEEIGDLEVRLLQDVALPHRAAGGSAEAERLAEDNSVLASRSHPALCHPPLFLLSPLDSTAKLCTLSWPFVPACVCLFVYL